jgi:mycothiol system anti-sigma-R factor
MSCGKPHEVPCSEVLALVYSYIDGEIEAGSYSQIRQHLDECGPCLREYGLEEVVKRLVHKCCGHEAVPDELRAKVLTRIAAVRAEIETTEIVTEETGVQ